MSSHHDPEENLPEWLRALRRKQSEQAAAEAAKAAAQAEAKAAAQPAAEDEPDWLADIRKRHSEEAAGDDSERALTDTQPNKPFRLESRRLPEPEFEEDAPAFEELPNEAVPAWLDEDEPQDTQDALDTPAFSEPAEPLAPGELPSWLQEARPADAPPAATSAFYDDYDDEPELTPAELENAGPLAGLSGVLPAEPEVARIGKAPVFSTRLEVNENQLRHAAVLRELIASEAQPAPDFAASIRRPARVLSLLMSGALLLAALLPLLSGSLQAARPEPEALPHGTAIFNNVDILPSGAPVLVIFDVQPALYGEVRAAASPVLGHLLDRQARLVFISTQTSGPALAERLLQQDFAQVPLVASHDYVSLGYLPGGMAAVRSFASAPRQAALSAPATFAQPWQRASLQAIQSLNDFALVLLVVSEAEDARIWLEQAGPALAEGLYVVSSAQAAPVLRAYLDTPDSPIRGMVAGVSGGAHYERLRARDTLSLRYWDSYSYQLGAVVLIILLGGLYGRVIHTQPEPVGKA